MIDKLLRVDLSTGTLMTEALDPELTMDYIGGRGFGVKLLYDELAPGVEPFSGENKLVFMTGPLTGLAPVSGRCAVISKSPLTNTVLDSNVGGNFGVTLRRAGFAGIIIEGISDKPVYLVLKNGRAELRDASALWGKNIEEATKLLAGEAKSIAAIGQAGERLVRFACISVDNHRHAGRGGLGAVMGAKKLKAVAVSGDKKLSPINEFAFKKFATTFREILKGHPITGDGLGRFGTLILMNPVNKCGVLPAKNFSVPSTLVENISGESMKTYLVRKKGCALCTINCGRISRIGNTTTSGPEFESTWALGPNLGIDDPTVLFEANRLCNDYGLDTISTGSVLAFAIEASKHGSLSEKLNWGDGSTVLKLIISIGERKGLGDILAEGTKCVSAQINAEELAMQVKGLDLPAYDPRGVVGQALGYATSNRGGCHLRAYMIPEEILSLPRYLDNLAATDKPRMVKDLENIFAVLDSLVICKFTTFAVFSTFEFEADIYAKLLTSATGFYFDEQLLKRAGERIYNLERVFNVREGFSAEDDGLPARFKLPISSGPAKGERIEIAPLVREYYELRGWDARGTPSDKKLKSLGIGSLSKWPKLQVALDLRDLEEAQKLAEDAARGGAHWIEVGTPLIKSVGMNAVRGLRELLPNKIIVADLKTMDTGFLEVELAAQAGADIVGVAGAADDHTIEDAVGASKKYNVQIMADLVSIKDPVKRAEELEKLGVDYIEFHVAVDEQLRADDKKIPFPLLKRVVEAVDIPVAVAGGMRADTVALALGSGAKIIVVGGSITRAANAEQAAKNILSKMRP